MNECRICSQLKMRSEAGVFMLVLIAALIMQPHGTLAATIVIAGGGPIVVSPGGAVTIAGSATKLKTSTDQIPSRPSFLLGQEAA
jgi:hypothetical protein